MALPPLPGTAPPVQALSGDEYNLCGADGEGVCVEKKLTATMKRSTKPLATDYTDVHR